MSVVVSQSGNNVQHSAYIIPVTTTNDANEKQTLSPIKLRCTQRKKVR